jgi:hypothetical protein
MKAPDRTTQHVREWLRQSTPMGPDAERSVDEVMSRLIRQTQLRPRLSFRFLRGRSLDEGGHSMFSALKLGLATAVVALLGGILALSVLPPQHQDQAPLAAATESASPEIALDDLPPYASITGQLRPGIATHVPDFGTDPATGRETGTDWAWRMELEANDPRLSGEYLSNHNYYLFEGDDRNSGSLRSGIGRVTNEGGSWSVEFHGFSKPGTNAIQANHYVTYLSGEGGYEGLSAILLMTPSGDHWAVDGVIAPGPMPEAPTSVDPSEAG